VIHRKTLCSSLAQVALFVCLIPITDISANAETLYRWVDEQGRVTFQGSPPIKKEFSKQEIKSASGKIDSSVTQPVEITFFAIKTCDACDVARQDLTQRQLRFTEINPETDVEAGRTLLLRFGKVQVPLFYIGDTVVKGYEPAWLASELEKAGFDLPPPTDEAL